MSRDCTNPTVPGAGGNRCGGLAGMCLLHARRLQYLQCLAALHACVGSVWPPAKSCVLSCSLYMTSISGCACRRRRGGGAGGDENMAWGKPGEQASTQLLLLLLLLLVAAEPGTHCIVRVGPDVVLADTCSCLSLCLMLDPAPASPDWPAGGGGPA